MHTLWHKSSVHVHSPMLVLEVRGREVGEDSRGRVSVSDMLIMV